FAVAHETHVCNGLGGAAEEFDLGVVLERAPGVGQVAKYHIDERGAVQRTGPGDDITALDIAPVDAAEVHRDAAAGLRAADGFLVALQAPDAGVQAAGLYGDLVPDM